MPEPREVADLSVDEDSLGGIAGPRVDRRHYENAGEALVSRGARWAPLHGAGALVDPSGKEVGDTPHRHDIVRL
jgi:hypothetical protein